MYVLSSPSGAGKTTITRALLKQNEDLDVSVSVTTRPRRPGEVQGQDYSFVDIPTFNEMIDNGEFLEHAKTNGTDLDTYRKLLECNPTTMRRAIAHLRRKYRSVARYMTEIGLEADIVGHLRNRLLTVD